MYIQLLFPICFVFFLNRTIFSSGRKLTHQTQVQNQVLTDLTFLSWSKKKLQSNLFQIRNQKQRARDPCHPVCLSKENQNYRAIHFLWHKISLCSRGSLIWFLGRRTCGTLIDRPSEWNYLPMRRNEWDASIEETHRISPKCPVLISGNCFRTLQNGNLSHSKASAKIFSSNSENFVAIPDHIKFSHLKGNKKFVKVWIKQMQNHASNWVRTWDLILTG